MAVLIEAFNVIVKLSAIEAKYPGGLQDYKKDSPTLVFCQDDHICRIGFSIAEHAEEWGNSLFSLGLDDEVNDVLQEVAFADNSKVLVTPCDWLDFSKDKNGTLWAWLRGTEMGEKSAHEGWAPGQFFWVDADALPEPVCESVGKWWQFWR